MLQIWPASVVLSVGDGAETASLQITNTAATPLHFAFRAAHADRYVVRPSTGVLSAGESCDILVAFQQMLTLVHASMRRGTGSFGVPPLPTGAPITVFDVLVLQFGHDLESRQTLSIDIPCELRWVCGASAGQHRHTFLGNTTCARESCNQAESDAGEAAAFPQIGRTDFEMYTPPRSEAAVVSLARNHPSPQRQWLDRSVVCLVLVVVLSVVVGVYVSPTARATAVAYTKRVRS